MSKRNCKNVFGICIRGKRSFGGIIIVRGFASCSIGFGGLLFAIESFLFSVKLSTNPVEVIEINWVGSLADQGVEIGPPCMPFRPIEAAYKLYAFLDFLGFFGGIFTALSGDKFVVPRGLEGLD